MCMRCYSEAARGTRTEEEDSKAREATIEAAEEANESAEEQLRRRSEGERDDIRFVRAPIGDL